MGRYVFGVAALLLGVASLVLRHQLISHWQLPGASAFLVITSIVQILGGGALLFPKTVRVGAIVLCAVYVLITLTCIPAIVALPVAYYTWGDVFYQLPLVVGAVIAYDMASLPEPNALTLSKAATIVLGLCSASFAIEQIEYLARTASLVPPWMPLGGAFWTWATTIAFGLAAIALVSGYKSLLAARLLALMLLIFTVAVWIPILFADSGKLSNWSEGLETFAIGAAAWIASEFLQTKRESGLATKPHS